MPLVDGATGTNFNCTFVQMDPQQHPWVWVPGSVFNGTEHV